MKERAARPWLLALALLLCRVAPSPCADRPTAVGAGSPRGDAPSPADLPSAVSPEIERFVKKLGRDLPPPLPRPRPRPREADRPSGSARGPSARPVFRLPPDDDDAEGDRSAVSSDVERLRDRGARDLPTHPPRAAGSPGDPARGPSARLILRLPPALDDGGGEGRPSSPNSRTPGPGGRSATTPSPLDTRPTLDPAPYDPKDVRFPINLATALRLSDARPLVVAAAQARAWVAEAELAQAKVLWLPDLFVGAAYTRHDGGGPDFNKGILTAPSVNFFYAGAGLAGVIATTDAIYEPLAARQVLTARHWEIQSAKNDALMQTADAYFRVHQYRGIYAGALYTITRGHQLIDRIASLSRDLVPAFEVDRARNMVADLEQRAVSARQWWRVESARLTKVLRLDPRAVVEPLERDHLQVTLIDPSRELDDLMPVALANRPEVASRRAMVAAAEVYIRQEEARPLIPLVLINGFQSPGGMQLQGGIFGIGPNSSLNQWTGRADASLQFIWQLDSLGVGNLARIKARRGDESRAIVELRRAQDRVAEEVNQAHARVQSAAARVAQADRALRTAIITLNGSTEGLEHTSRFEDMLILISRPQEAVYALQLLMQAFDEYFTTVAEYNLAQFALFHALGYPAREVAERHLPGEVRPVETARPAYLPPVGNGPPPATR